LTDSGDHNRTMRLVFGTYAWEMIGEAARGRGLTTGELVQDACFAYGDRLFHGRFSSDAPRFRVRDGSDREVQIAIPERVWTDLRLEAGRQGIEVEELVEHAVILRVGESGEVVRRWRRGFEIRARSLEHARRRKRQRR
jgi:hypothetical protein